MAQSMSEYSRRSYKIHVLDHYGNALTEASGFAVLRHDKCYLVTNWHIAEGKNPESETFLPPANLLYRPASLRVTMPGAWANRNPRQHTFSLYDEENERDSGLPTPYFNTADGIFAGEKPHTDVIALPITGEPLEVFKKYAYEIVVPDTSGLEVTDTVYVVGYPQGETLPLGAPPIWTRGSIAAEPDTEYTRTQYLVDCWSRPGQSGSPVIQYQKSFEFLAPGGLRQLQVESGRLIGIYAGRTDQEQRLGRVLPIENIIDATDNPSLWL